MDTKSSDRIRLQETNPDTGYHGSDFTYTDQQDMQRMGKKQELRRNFRFFSILGFVAIGMGVSIRAFRYGTGEKKATDKLVSC